MKTPKPASRITAFTLVEAMVTVGLSMLVGGMIYLVLNSGMHLYAKNTAVNAAHQQARSGVDQLLQNLHGSVSIPQMVDQNLDPNTVPVIGPAAGISFQLFDRGPFPVVADASATSTSIVLNSGSFVPAANSRLNIPNHDIELDVVSSTDLGSGKRRYNFASPIKVAVTISANGDDSGSGDDDDDGGVFGAPAYLINAFMTKRVGYAVNGTELRYYATNNLGSYRVIARNVTSAMPFTVPTLSGGLRNRYVAAVNISTVEPQFTERGYAAVNMFISSLIPFRSRLTTLQ